MLNSKITGTYGLTDNIPDSSFMKWIKGQSTILTLTYVTARNVPVSTAPLGNFTVNSQSSLYFMITLHILKTAKDRVT